MTVRMIRMLPHTPRQNVKLKNINKVRQKTQQSIKAFNSTKYNWNWNPFMDLGVRVVCDTIKMIDSDYLMTIPTLSFYNCEGERENDPPVDQ